jgi:hypothetical protein
MSSFQTGRKIGIQVLSAHDLAPRRAVLRAVSDTCADCKIKKGQRMSAALSFLRKFAINIQIDWTVTT